MMQLHFISFLFFIWLFIFNALSASEYTISLIGTETHYGIRWNVKGINDKGQAFGAYQDDANQIHAPFISDGKGHLSILEDKKHSYQGNYLIANNSGLIVGVWNGGGGNPNFIWTKALGVRSLEIFGTHITPYGLNDLGQLVGTYFDYSSRKPRAFLWDNGILTDMGIGSEFCKKLEQETGYSVLDIVFSSINNKGELAGYFEYGKYSERMKRIIPVGYKVFYWNGSLNLLPLDLEWHPIVLKLNYRGIILVNANFKCDKGRSTEITHTWTLDNGLQSLPDFYGESLNDSGVVLGRIRKPYSCCKCDGYEEIPAIWKEGHCILLSELLGVADLQNIAEPYSDTYEIERITRAVEINNKGQIICEGYMWGETHPCILEPTTSDRL